MRDLESAIKTKICTKCGIEKDISLFYNDRKGRDGIASICKSCNGKYGKEHYLAYRFKAIPGRVKCACSICNKEFYVAPSQSIGRKYCSDACAAVGTSQGYEKKRIERTCQFCGKIITVKPSAVIRGQYKYCSKKCFIEDRNITAHCLQCGAEFKTYKSVVENNLGKFCSQSCSSVWRAMHTEPNYHKCSKSGKREDIGNRYFRSSWEANYARYLNWLVAQGEIKQWEYEVDTFQFPVKRGNMTYLPDFKITNSDGSIEYHEVKGYMDKDSEVKLNRMTKYYPEIKVVLIDKPVYKALNKQLCRLIANWE